MKQYANICAYALIISVIIMSKGIVYFHYNFLGRPSLVVLSVQKKKIPSSPLFNCEETLLVGVRGFYFFYFLNLLFIFLFGCKNCTSWGCLVVAKSFVRVLYFYLISPFLDLSCMTISHNYVNVKKYDSVNSIFFWVQNSFS